MEVFDIDLEAVIKTIPKKNKCKKAKGLSKEALQTAEKRSAEFQRIARRHKKAFLSEQCKEIAKKIIEWARPETSSRKSEIPREHFM